MRKLTDAQIRVMKWLGNGWRTEPGPGSTVIVNGARVCNTDTMTALQRAGLVSQDSDRRWSATDAGKALCEQLKL